MVSFFLSLFAYLIGAIPTGFMIARFAGIEDITRHGSGNIGATNVARVAGKKYFLLVFLTDAAKAGLYLLLLQYFGMSVFILYVCAIFLIIGNSFSLFLGGKGGKGVATSVGIIAFFKPYILCITLLFWLSCMFKTRNVGISSVLAFLLFPIIVFAIAQHITDFFLLSIVISWWGIWRHAENIKQFLNIKAA